MTPTSRVPLLAALSLSMLCPLTAGAETTVWIASVGVWEAAAHWSNGEPTAEDDAEIRTTATAIVTQAGETCRTLTTGIDGDGATLRIEGGSLDVVEKLHVGFSHSGVILQTGGALSASEFKLGNDETSASCAMSGGSLSVERAQLGPSATFAMSTTAPAVTISDSLVVEDGSSFVFGAGTLVVGSPAGGARIDGAFTLGNASTPTLGTVTMSGFTMSESATFSAAVGAFGIPTLVVNGPATIAGDLLVIDILAPEGTYEILEAASIQGAFSGIFATPEWSWRIEGNSVLLTKSAEAVEPASWGRIKAAYGE